MHGGGTLVNFYFLFFNSILGDDGAGSVGGHLIACLHTYTCPGAACLLACHFPSLFIVRTQYPELSLVITACLPACLPAQINFLTIHMFMFTLLLVLNYERERNFIFLLFGFGL